MDRYFVNGHPLSLGPVLGEGGEAVVRMGNISSSRKPPRAYKLWKMGIATPQMMKLRRRKVGIAVGMKFQPEVFAPIEAVNNDDDDMVGFGMEPYPTGILDLEDLASSNIWENHRLSQLDAVTIALNLYDLAVGIHDHSLEVLVGDGNSRNFGFDPVSKRVIACDVDTYQFGPKNPCVMGTDDFLAPRQYAKDLTSLQFPFMAEDDWWWFTVNFFRLLFRVHPFRKGQSDVDLTADRVLLGLHVLNPQIPYPSLRVAMPLRSIPDRTLTLFKQIFDAKRVESFPRDELVWLSQQFVECPNHGGYKFVYAKERRECPHCMKDKTVPVLTAAAVVVVSTVKGVVVKLIFKSSAGRRLLLAKRVTSQSADRIFLLCVDLTGNLVGVWLDPVTGGTKETRLPLKFNPRQEYDVNADHLLVVQDGKGQLLDLNGSLKAEFETSVYARRNVAALGASNPVWLIGPQLVHGKYLFKQLLPEPIMNLTYGNVWFTSAGDGHNDVIVGFTNLFGNYQWFAYVDGLFQNLEIKTDPNEHMLDWLVIFDGSSFAVIRRLQKGRKSPEVRVSVFDKAKLLFETGLPVDTLEGQGTLSKGSFLYPTDGGVLRARAGEKSTILPGSQNVPTNSRLIAANGQLYVADTDCSVYIVTK